MSVLAAAVGGALECRKMTTGAEMSKWRQKEPIDERESQCRFSGACVSCIVQPNEIWKREAHRDQEFLLTRRRKVVGKRKEYREKGGGGGKELVLWVRGRKGSGVSHLSAAVNQGQVSNYQALFTRDAHNRPIQDPRV